MSKKIQIIISLVFLSLFLFSYSSPEQNKVALTNSNRYEGLVSLFNEFRDFLKPKIKNGVPDYTPAAMEKQYQGLKDFQKRLAAIDTSGWPISQKVDYLLVWAEMNGLEFSHRFLRSWSRDPSFYLVSQGGNGPTMYSSLRIPRKLPMSAERITDFKAGLQAVPVIFSQAKKNLTEAAGDLASIAIWGAKEEAQEYDDLAARLSKYHPELIEDIKQARAAVEDYEKWLEENKSMWTAPAGVGKENYNWLLKNVYLLPYTWEECKNIVFHEDYRVITFLKLEENRNRELPPLKPVASKEEYRRSVYESLDYVMKFIRDNKIFTLQDYLEVETCKKDRWHGLDKPWPKVHDYFFNFSHRESLPEETHECIGHHFDELRLEHDNRPIRGVTRLFNIDETRSEGFAFGLEELLMHAGYLDERPRRSREIVYQQATFRTCRALADLKMHSHEFDLEKAMKFCIGCAPRGDLLEGSHHLMFEMATTLRFVGWHMRMVVGKVRFMQLIRDVARQRGDKFNLGQFMDELLEEGMIPFTLSRWEITGYDNEIKELLADHPQELKKLLE
ncbi:MAG: DUF885 family protein [Acidobacteriota bacterium]|nr:DUF885 family protein [Acidobacteriota bacterium]